MHWARRVAYSLVSDVVFEWQGAVDRSKSFLGLTIPGTELLFQDSVGYLQQTRYEEIEFKAAFKKGIIIIIGC